MMIRKSILLEEDLVEKLEKAGDKNQRTFSQELRYRLDQSFHNSK